MDNETPTTHPETTKENTMLHPARKSSSNAYSRWIDAAALAHRTGDPEAKIKAERLHTEMKFAGRRSNRSRALMNRN